SAPCHAHVPSHRGSAADPEIMPSRLAREQPIEKFVDCAAAFGPQGVAQLDFLIVAEASVNRPGGRDPYAVAAVAKIIGQGRDQAEADAQLLHLEIASGPTRSPARRHQRELLLEASPDQVQR